MNKRIGIVLAGLALLGTAPVWADGASGPPTKFAAAKAQGGLDLTTNPSLGVQITSKRRKKKILVVQGVQILRLAAPPGRPDGAAACACSGLCPSAPETASTTDELRRLEACAPGKEELQVHGQ